MGMRVVGTRFKVMVSTPSAWACRRCDVEGARRRDFAVNAPDIVAAARGALDAERAVEDVDAQVGRGDAWNGDGDGHRLRVVGGARRGEVAVEIVAHGGGGGGGGTLLRARGLHLGEARPHGARAARA